MSSIDPQNHSTECNWNMNGSTVQSNGACRGTFRVKRFSGQIRLARNKAWFGLRGLFEATDKIREGQRFHIPPNAHTHAQKTHYYTSIPYLFVSFTCFLSRTVYTLYIYIHISHLGGVYISFCPELGAISYIFYIYVPSSGHFPHIFAHICPELGTITNSIVPNSGYMCFCPDY